MTALRDRVLASRARNYRDADTDPGRADWSDPVDAVAIALRAFTYMTPEAAATAVSAEIGRSDLAATWARLNPTDRQLWRRRAATALEIADTITEGGP